MASPSSPATFGFNIDNQLDSPSGFAYDLAGGPTAQPAGGIYAGDTVGYDAERRLAEATSGSTTKIANIYDGGGQRAIKTTPSDGTVYFLYDATTGEPVVEETYSGTSPTLSAVSAFGADGLRERCQASTGTFTAFDYDPQGTLSDRSSSANTTAPCADIAVWDAYGQERSDQSSSFTVDQQYNENDPVGFEGQYGYYGDWEMPLASEPQQYLYLRQYPNLLTSRYYDPSTGKFASRDPIGTNGGENLYGYAGDDPVNEVDPSGEDVAVGPKGTPWLVLGNLNYGQSKRFLAGEGRAANAVTWVTGGYNLVRQLSAAHWSRPALAEAGEGFVNGLEFWRMSDPYRAGESFMTDVIIASPLLKKVPNPTPIELGDPMLTPKTGAVTGATLLRISVDGKQIFRADIGRLPIRGSIPPALRDRLMPRYHRSVEDPDNPGNSRPGQSLRRHRPWQSGAGSRF